MHEIHRAGLRAVLAGLFDEVDVASDPEILESPAQHAVAVKIDFRAIRRFEEPVARLREQFGHLGSNAGLMMFCQAPHTARVIL